MPLSANARNWQAKTKYRTSTGLVLCPQATAMSFNDGTSNRQSHPHAALFGREERVKDSLQDIRADPRTGIRNRQLRRVLVNKLCPNRTPANIASSLGKRIDCIRNQIKNDLLQLNAVTFDNQGMGGVNDNPTSSCLGGQNSDYFTHNLIQVDIFRLDFGLG